MYRVKTLIKKMLLIVALFTVEYSFGQELPVNQISYIVADGSDTFSLELLAVSYTTIPDYFHATFKDGKTESINALQPSFEIRVTNAHAGRRLVGIPAYFYISSPAFKKGMAGVSKDATCGCMVHDGIVEVIDKTNGADLQMFHDSTVNGQYGLYFAAGETKTFTVQLPTVYLPELTGSFLFGGFSYKNKSNGKNIDQAFEIDVASRAIIGKKVFYQK